MGACTVAFSHTPLPTDAYLSQRSQRQGMESCSRPISTIFSARTTPPMACSTYRRRDLLRRARRYCMAHAAFGLPAVANRLPLLSAVAHGWNLGSPPPDLAAFCCGIRCGGKLDGIHRPPVKTTEAGGPRGYNAGKNGAGRKRHLLVDSSGLLLATAVWPLP